MITCKEVHEFLMAYLGAELEAPERDRFEAHLAKCPCCKNYMTTYQQAVALSSEAYEPCEGEEHPELPEELIAAVLAARRQRDDS